LDVLLEALRRFANDPEEAMVHGKAGREEALVRFGLERFLRDWDAVLEEAVA
jgi:hypothetical protein